MVRLVAAPTLVLATFPTPTIFSSPSTQNRDMATGIPSRGGKSRVSYRLEYDGKTPESEILNGEQANAIRILSVPGSPVNRMYYGDNLYVLRTLAYDPEIAGRVRLIYIDPPYATGGRFECRQQVHAYDDHLVGSDYLEFLRQRLVLLHQILAEDGSIYLHLDENAAHYAKVLMDEIFGESNFRAWITRKKCNPKNYTRKTFGNVSDYILFYSKSSKYVWEQQYEPLDAEKVNREYRHLEAGSGRRYMLVPLHAPGTRNGETGKEWRGMLPPPGKHWQYTPRKLDEFERRGEIIWSENGNPRRKVYLDERPGVPVQDIWLEFRDAHNQMVKITGYPTEKNPEMIRRIIRASTKPGDLVLDAFGGSGTTAQIAEELGRQWVMIDSSPLAMETMVTRLARGSERMGDFVKSRSHSKKLAVQIDLADRVLKSGLDIYRDTRSEPEPITMETTQEWAEKLGGEINSPAIHV